MATRQFLEHYSNCTRFRAYLCLICLLETSVTCRRWCPVYHVVKLYDRIWRKVFVNDN